MKKLIAVAALAALAFPALPSAAATVNKTITVKWNTQAVATLNVHTDYSNTGAFGAAAGAIVANLNGGSGACTAADPTNADLTDDFGAVTPDAAQWTDCMYKNSANAQVVTNSTSWSLTASTVAALPAGYGLCALPNGAAAFPFTAAALPVTQTARATAPSIASSSACGAGNVLLSTTPATLANESNAFGSGSPANIGHDLELAVPPIAASGSQTVTVTYTLVAS